MGISGLDAFLAANKLQHTAPLSALRDTRLGIDLALYLRNLLSSPKTSEPLVAALSGSPLALISHVEADLRALEKARIKPVFILSGLAPHKKSRPFTFPDPRADLRRKAWARYESGDVDGTHEDLARSNSVREHELVRAILRAFRHRNVEFIVAPYLADGQLVSLERHSKSYIHAIYGSTTVLLFDRVDKLILSLDLQAGTFTFASKLALMQTLQCNEEEFLDMGLLCGFDHCPTFPPVMDGTIPGVMTSPAALRKEGGGGAPGAAAGASSSSAASTSTLPCPNPRAIMDIVKQHRSGFTACTAFAEHPQVQKIGYVDTFCRARCVIKFCLVLSAEEGRVLPLPLATPPLPANAAAIAPGVNGASPAVPGLSNGAPIPTASDVPVDLHEIFSHRLPDELFLHLSRGLISPTVSTYLTSGHVVEPPPLSPDAGSLEAYRRFVRETLTESSHSPRCVAIALTTSALNGFWSGKKINAIYWWDPARDHPVAHDSAQTLQMAKRTGNWNVHVGFVEEELRRQNSSTIDIALCLGATGSEALASRTKTPRTATTGSGGRGSNAGATGAAAAAAASGAGAPQQLEKKDEVVANVIWRFLELRGFLNHDHLHTPWARSLHLALRASRLNDKLQEPLYMALELIRAGALHGSPYAGKVLSGGPSYGDVNAADETEKQVAKTARSHLLLIMRCLSLLPMTFKPQPWTAPLSRELLLFATFSRGLSRSLRLLVESIVSSMLLKGDARRARDDYLDIGLSLPFASDPNTGLGIVAKCYLEALMTFLGGPVETGRESDAEVVDAKEAVLEMLDKTFENVKDVKMELQRGFRFWEALMKAVQTLKAEKSISGELVRQFEAAHKWLKPMAQL